MGYEIFIVGKKKCVLYVRLRACMCVCVRSKTSTFKKLINGRIARTHTHTHTHILTLSPSLFCGSMSSDDLLEKRSSGESVTRDLPQVKVGHCSLP